MFSIRQGDVFVFSAPKSAKPLAPIARDNGRIVLAYGEVTGHAHAIHDRDAEMFALPNTDDRFLRARGPSTCSRATLRRWSKHDGAGVVKRPVARGRVRVPGAMNKTEADYRDMLWARQKAGEIAWFGYERWTFKLADDTRYTPDFAVMLANGELEAHEVKGGFEREDARVKRKVAAEQFPIRFIFAQKKDGRWTITEI